MLFNRFYCSKVGIFCGASRRDCPNFPNISCFSSGFTVPKSENFRGASRRDRPNFPNSACFSTGFTVPKSDFFCGASRRDCPNSPNIPCFSTVFLFQRWIFLRHFPLQLFQFPTHFKIPNRFCWSNITLDCMAGGAHGMVAGLIAINSLRNPFAEQFHKSFSPIRKSQTRIKKIIWEQFFQKSFSESDSPGE